MDYQDIIKHKELNRKLLKDYENKLQVSLETHCEDYYGHLFSRWEKTSQPGLYNRFCNYCDKLESVDKKEIKTFLKVSSKNLKESGDIDGLEYRIRNSYKIEVPSPLKDFKKGELVIIVTEDYRMVSEVTSVLEDSLIINLF